MMEGYTTTGAPNLLSYNHMQWCEICETWGCVTHSYTMLNKYQKTDHTPFCEFFMFVGHDVKKL